MKRIESGFRHAAYHVPIMTIEPGQSAEPNVVPAPRRWHHVFTAFFSELQAEDAPYLFSAAPHPNLLTIRRATVIISRVRLLAILFAILTPSWSVIDYFVFPTNIWTPMTLLRVSAGFAFLAIFLCYSSKERFTSVYRALVFLFLIPSLFYPASQYLFTNSQLTGDFAHLVAVAYTFLPFILMACLAIFPLSFKESLTLSLLVLSAQLVGILLPHNDQLINNFSTLWLLALLGGIATTAGISQLALMIVLVRQAVRDALTGCLTRSSGEELLALQFSIAQRGKTTLSLAFIDLDHFKSVNDQFGHETGDVILRHAAIAIAKTLRDSDLLVRWGGEEFLIIMPSTSLEQAKTAMERLCRFGLCKRPDGSTITASIGISEVWNDAVSDQNHLIELADQRMYLAKQAGRNTIFFSGGAVPAAESHPTQKVHLNTGLA
ncbi:MAG: GGDEF domain-containing protein [Zoogloeaceae bacterium]|nr:GGDEF domain-containing protein [Zoogloeaceae bacterium]